MQLRFSLDLDIDILVTHSILEMLGNLFLAETLKKPTWLA